MYVYVIIVAPPISFMFDFSETWWHNSFKSPRMVISREVSALRLMGIPHSHDFSEGPPPQELLRQASHVVNGCEKRGLWKVETFDLGKG